jgi:hypothetical protein
MLFKLLKLRYEKKKTTEREKERGEEKKLTIVGVFSAARTSE